MTQLPTLTNDNKVQIQRRSVLEKLIKDKLAITEARSALCLLTKRSYAISAESKRRMDLLRKHVALMIDTERVLMDTRNRQADRSFRNTLVIIFVLSLTDVSDPGRFIPVAGTGIGPSTDKRPTSSWHYDAQLRGQIRQLEASNEELERFAFVASHDLQEPLRKIQSFSNLITDRYGNLFDADSMLFHE